MKKSALLLLGATLVTLSMIGTVPTLQASTDTSAAVCCASDCPVPCEPCDCCCCK